MSEEVEGTDLIEAVQKALSDALGSNGEAIITRWVLSVERYTGEGKSVAHLASMDMQSWEVVGMAEMASEYARVQASSEMIDQMYAIDDEDDD